MITRFEKWITNMPDEILLETLTRSIELHAAHQTILQMCAHESDWDMMITTAGSASDEAADLFLLAREAKRRWGTV